MGERQVTSFEDLYKYVSMMADYEVESRHDENENGSAIISVPDSDAIEQLRVDTSSEFTVTRNGSQAIVAK